MLNKNGYMLNKLFFHLQNCFPRNNGHKFHVVNMLDLHIVSVSTYEFVSEMVPYMEVCIFVILN